MELGPGVPGLNRSMYIATKFLCKNRIQVAMSNRYPSFTIGISERYIEKASRCKIHSNPFDFRSTLRI